MKNFRLSADFCFSFDPIFSPRKSLFHEKKFLIFAARIHTATRACNKDGIGGDPLTYYMYMLAQHLYV